MSGSLCAEYPTSAAVQPSPSHSRPHPTLNGNNRRSTGPFLPPKLSAARVQVVRQSLWQVLQQEEL